jgi:hypothetical protein
LSKGEDSKEQSEKNGHFGGVTVSKEENELGGRKVRSLSPSLPKFHGRKYSFALSISL